jgi:hypothetical protein
MVRDNRHKAADIFTAICPQRGAGTAMITPAVNAGLMTLHLAEISTQVTECAHAFVGCDGVVGTSGARNEFCQRTSRC